jgi:2-polyprenyl-6-methoxyphenol hydroxylase-like FAD-dependent oxidoreductase
MGDVTRAPGKDSGILIVGGGPVGLALAAELGRLNVACTLVEARDGTINQPKMNFVNVRSMEFVRRWGITARVREEGHPENFRPNVIWVTSVTGHEIARLNFPPFREENTRFFSPASDCLISQYWFDPILLDHVRTLSTVTLRHRTRLESFRETNDGIEATIKDQATGKTEKIAAAYLVGADGANSTVRDALGIELKGLAHMQDNWHIFLNSTQLIDIFESKLGHARFTHLVGADGAWGMITSINWRGLWRFSMQPPPKDESKENITKLLYRAIGREFEFELLNASHWESRKLVADTFRKGRVFVAGDAAHQNNPTGGFGMNTGLGDAMDLAWKLTAALQGWGGEALLDSYDAERRPISVRNVEEATRNFNLPRRYRFGPHIAEEGAAGEADREAFKQSLYDADIMRHHDTDGIAMGYRYASPVVIPDGTPEPPDEVRGYTPTARPGHRAPHVWLSDGVSLLDSFGDGFMLLDFGGDPASLVRAAAERNVPLRVEKIDSAEARALYERKLVLVRPDGHVAWRGDAAPSDALTVIDTVRGAVVPARQAKVA